MTAPRIDIPRRGFSLIEMLMAIFILGIGVISIAALFPAGIAQQRRSVDEVMGPIVAGNALSILRGKLSQEDFGTFEEFVQTPIPADVEWLITIPGDWPWLRPGFILSDDPSTDTYGGEPYNDMGDIDVFSHRFALGTSATAATEFPNGLDTALPNADALYGVPYNPGKYDYDPTNDFLDPTDPRLVPAVTITQGERSFPQKAGYWLDDPGTGAANRPDFFWDCMFRRFEGRIQVAIFVYRVTYPPGRLADYRVSANPSNNEVPPLPIALDLTDPANGDVSPDGPWEALGDFVRGGGNGGAAYDYTDHRQAWQESRQWILDQNNNVHRVLSRTAASSTENEIEFIRPVQEMQLDVVLVGSPAFPIPVVPIYAYPGDPQNPGQPNEALDTDGNSLYDTNVVGKIWYVPATYELDTNGDGERDTPVTLTPVFLMVEEL